MECLIALAKTPMMMMMAAAQRDEVDDDAEYGDGTERCNNQIEATAAAGGNWLEGRAEARRASHECRAKAII
jgi:hypothetical protein